MDNSLISYLERQSTEVLLLLLRQENDPRYYNYYIPETFDIIRNILDMRQVSYGD